MVVMDWEGLLRTNRQVVEETIQEYCLRAGRSPADVTLLAVSKTQPLEAVLAARRVGFDYFGENRVQEAREKQEKAAFEGARLDIIGHVQSNKIKSAVEVAQGIQSVDSEETARELSRRAQQQGKVLEILLEYNTSGEEQKFGVRHFGDLERLAELVLRLPNLEFRGLMTLAPFVNDEKKIRSCFAQLYQARQRLQDKLHTNLPVLSMGMSGDYPWAILEGSTLVRLGTALFGGRT